jgi:phosphohistidine phosphatase
MTKTLVVVRHGHAVEGEADFARRLSPRGVSEVNASAQQLSNSGCKFDAVLTSSAARASETAALIARGCDFQGSVQQVNDLYLAEPRTILKRVCATDDAVNTLLLVGHNPGLSAFVEQMTGQICELHTAQVVHLKLNVEHWDDVAF